MTEQVLTVCTRYPVETLSAYADGDLPAAETHLIRAHLADCTRCAGVLTELGALASATRTLDRPEPPPSLWPAVAGALDRHERPWWMALRLFGTGALAGAAAVSVAALALSSWRAHEASPAAAPQPPVVAAPIAAARDPLLDEAESEFARAAAAYESSIEKLRGLIAREEPRWTQEERALYSERLFDLDDAIARSREIARKSPADSAGNEQLFAAYRHKIAFLAEAVHRGGAWSGGERP
jgi:putative zinc finger protein